MWTESVWQFPATGTQWQTAKGSVIEVLDSDRSGIHYRFVTDEPGKTGYVSLATWMGMALRDIDPLPFYQSAELEQPPIGSKWLSGVSYDPEFIIRIVQGPDVRDSIEQLVWFLYEDLDVQARCVPLKTWNEWVRDYSFIPIDDDDQLRFASTNPIDYEYVPLTDYELSFFDQLPRHERMKWFHHATNLNRRGIKFGKEGKVSARELYGLAQRFENKCAYCDKDLNWGTDESDSHSGTFDHNFPLDIGGDNTAANLLPACYPCNNALEQWDVRQYGPPEPRELEANPLLDQPESYDEGWLQPLGSLPLSWRMEKEASWKEVSEHAQLLREEGKVHILRNTPELVVARVDSGTKEGVSYDTELNRQDPTNPLALSSWSCTCPWGEKWAWQRTRGYKKFEGRTCKHALAATWQGMSLPYDDEGGDMGGGQPPPMPEPQMPPPQQQAQPEPEMMPPPGVIAPGTMPAGPPVPGGANPALPGAVQIAPNQVPQVGPAPAAAGVGQAPAGPGPGVSSQPTQPGQGGTVSIPGALSSWKESAVDDEFKEGDYVEVHMADRGGYENGTIIGEVYSPDSLMGYLFTTYFRVRLDSGQETDCSWGYMTLLKPAAPEGQGELPFWRDKHSLQSPSADIPCPHCGSHDTFEGLSYPPLLSCNACGERFDPDRPPSPPEQWAMKASWKYSAFANGDIVRANQPMTGEDRDGNTLPVNRNAIGEVLSSDEITSVVIFPLHDNMALEPHLVKVEGFTSDFSLATGMSPFIRRRRQSSGPWEIEHTDQFENWYLDLDQDSQEKVRTAVALLEQAGPSLRRPYVGEIAGSSIKNLKELIPPGSTMRILFCFDPRRVAILLYGDDKAQGLRDNWNDWYDQTAKPQAEQLYSEHLDELRAEGLTE